MCRENEHHDWLKQDTELAHLYDDVQVLEEETFSEEERHGSETVVQSTIEDMSE